MFKREEFRELLRTREVEKDKEVNFEKGDFLALIIAATTIFLPIILIFMGGLALFIWLLILFIH